ncbi:MAG: hypothetical protein ACE3JK_03120 [Sporolactobacillus sp.]
MDKFNIMDTNDRNGLVKGAALMGLPEILGSVFHSISGKSAAVRNNGAKTQTRVYLLRLQDEVIR